MNLPRCLVAMALLGLALAPLVGCSQDEPAAPPPATPKRTASAAAPKPVEKAVEAPALPEFNYEPTGKRDPFKPPVDVERPPDPDRGEVASREDAEPRGPLEELDVLEWRLVGVVQTPGRPRALVQGPAGRGFIIEEGTRIGRWKGEVATIDEDRITVIERFVDSRGGVRTQEIPLYLRIPEDESLGGTP